MPVNSVWGMIPRFSDRSRIKKVAGFVCGSADADIVVIGVAVLKNSFWGLCLATATPFTFRVVDEGPQEVEANWPLLPSIY